jgi:hypothetical protein
MTKCDNLLSEDIKITETEFDAMMCLVEGAFLKNRRSEWEVEDQ